MDAAAIIDAVIAQTGTDAARTTILSMLNEQYQTQVVRSKWLLETVTVGTTVADQADYSLSDTVVDILSLRVGTTVYEGISTEQYWGLLDGSARVSGSPGVYALTYSSSGGTSVSLYPAPDTAGVAITVLTPATATALTDSGSSNPVTPSDTHGSLIDGTAALILLRVDERPDLAPPFEARFQASIELLRRRKNARGGDNLQAQIQGVHF